MMSMGCYHFNTASFTIIICYNLYWMTVRWNSLSIINDVSRELQKLRDCLCSWLANLYLYQLDIDSIFNFRLELKRSLMMLLNNQRKQI